MDRDLSSFGWAVLFPPWSNSAHHPHEGTVRQTRDEAIRVIGAAWAREGETDKQGWRRAYRAGWRCVHVQITPIFFGGEPS